jgi:glucose/arabinose dehydrogenase
VLAVAIAVASCTEGNVRDSRPPQITLTAAFNGVTFPFAVDLLQHPTDDHRWYVVEQGGVVETFLDTDPAGTRTTAVTLAGIITTGESGLLGMAFHPSFAINGQVFLSYVDAAGGPFGTSTIARYVSLDNGLTFVIDPNPPAIVLQLVQPAANHNGGDLDFGPDGDLYVAFGDGGPGGDPNGYGQTTNEWFGSILRLDVDSARPYAIPASNPFAGGGGLPEIWAFGFRNPWRMAFDSMTGELFVGDVGQNTVEEIDLVMRGGNYGWSVVEGTLTYPSMVPSAPMGMIPPIVTHLHPECQSITGGHIYRGTTLPQLQGMYVYGDFITGRIFALDPTMASPMPTEIHQAALNISSFGHGRDGEMYAVAYGAAGAMHRLTALP